MTLPLLLGSAALLLVAAAMGLWWGVAIRVQQRAAAEHAETRLSQAATARGGDDPRRQRPRTAYWASVLQRAGLAGSARTLVLLVTPGIVLAIAAGLRLGAFSFGLFVFVLYLLAAGLWLHRRTEKMQQRLVAQMPDLLENMVRIAGIGNSLSMAFQNATQNTDPPLRPILDNALACTRAGMDLDRALQQAAQAYQLRPLEMLAVILGTSIRIGGRSDQILQRMSEFMRDLEEAQRELQATTSETRMSAWVLGLLPIGSALFMALLSPDFFQPMFHDPMGRRILLAAVVLELVGAFLLYRLARSL